MGTKEDKKLCKLAKKDFPEKHFDRYAGLVRDPTYVCIKCGRAAESGKNLCKPKKL
ncbi:MAG: hypothetical protein ACOCYA_04185 [Spirochaetota bacterium]